MDVLIMGDTAGTHAIAWKLAESRRTGELYTTSPYDGITTLCSRAENTEEWRAAHPDGYIIPPPKRVFSRPAEREDNAIISVLCFTDGKTVVPMPAVRLYRENSEIVRAIAPAEEFTPNIAQCEYAKDYRGVICYTYEICDGDTRLLSVTHGFGEMEAMALLPLLRGELLPILLACDNGTLKREMVRINDTNTDVRMMNTRPGEHIAGLASVAKNTGVFMGAVRYVDGMMYAAGERAAFVCERKKNDE
jgi:phosphoribosylamine-glycine ligase